jgi:pimeloyl-ACP methyl ester carboxylesterase
MIRRTLAGAAAFGLSALTLRSVSERSARRLLDAPRVRPGEEALGPALDALGGEVVRIRSRDGLRLSARWLPGESDETGWRRDPHEAILLLHGYHGSIAPDLVEYGPFLRRSAGVLGLDFRGHGGSDAARTTFGLHEVEDVAGALAWLGSMGGMTAIVSVVVLGDGALASADHLPDDPSGPPREVRPRIVAVVADSVASSVVVPVAARMPGPAPTFLAERLFDAAARTLGADPRATDPVKVVGLVDPVPLLLIHGEADTTVPAADGRRLAAAAGPSAQHWIVPGAEHGRAHAADPSAYEARVTAFLRSGLAGSRTGVPIIGDPGPTTVPIDPAAPVED